MAYLTPTTAGDGYNAYVYINLDHVVSARVARASNISTLYVTTADGVEHEIKSHASRDYVATYLWWMFEENRQDTATFAPNPAPNPNDYS